MRRRCKRQRAAKAPAEAGYILSMRRAVRLNGHEVADRRGERESLLEGKVVCTAKLGHLTSCAVSHDKIRRNTLLEICSKR